MLRHGRRFDVGVLLLNVLRLIAQLSNAVIFSEAVSNSEAAGGFAKACS
jgi:hypothetical protein